MTGSLDPDEALGAGPYFFIAVPDQLTARIPLNATRLLREWEMLLDPSSAIAQAAGAGVDWTSGDWFVEPTHRTIEMIRAALDSQALQEALARSNSLFVWGGNTGDRRTLTRLFMGADASSTHALWVLLGLAVYGAVLHRAGYHSQTL
jgi:hypothetical protein